MNKLTGFVNVRRAAERPAQFESDEISKHGAFLKTDLVLSRLPRIQRGDNSSCRGIFTVITPPKNSILEQMRTRLQFRLLFDIRTENIQLFCDSSYE
jgi:hypothetical protein